MHPRAPHLERRFYALMLLDRYLWRGAHSASPRFARKQALVDALHTHSGFERPRDPEPVVEIEAAELTRERFWELSEGLRKVVVVRNFAQTRATRSWTPGSLADRLHGHSCAVLKYERETFERGWDVGAELIEMDVCEYLRRMVDEELYLSNSTELVNKCPSLVEDLELERIRASFLPQSQWDELITTNFFISSDKVYTSIHHAMGGNFFLQIAGRKRWTLVDPTWTAYLHPVNGRPFQYCNSAFGGFRACARAGRDEDNPLARLPHGVVTLEPGDLLYNAPWWWHEVENLDPFTVGCAVRHIPRPGRASPSWANHALFTATSTYPAMRALTFADYARKRLTGHQRPLRELVNELQVRMLYRSLERRRELTRR